MYNSFRAIVSSAFTGFVLLLAVSLLPASVQAQTFAVVDGVVRPPNSGSQRTRHVFTFPEFTENTRLTARFTIAALDDDGVDQNNTLGGQRDRFDRAGYFYFEDTDGGEIELVKFITGFGGSTVHERDVTDLLPKLFRKNSQHWRSSNHVHWTIMGANR